MARTRKNPYSVLGLNEQELKKQEDRGYESITKAYRKLARECHPDIFINNYPNKNIEDLTKDEREKQFTVRGSNKFVNAATVAQQQEKLTEANNAYEELITPLLKQRQKQAEAEEHKADRKRAEAPRAAGMGIFSNTPSKDQGEERKNTGPIPHQAGEYDYLFKIMLTSDVSLQDTLSEMCGLSKDKSDYVIKRKLRTHEKLIQGNIYNYFTGERFRSSYDSLSRSLRGAHAVLCAVDITDKDVDVSESIKSCARSIDHALGRDMDPIKILIAVKRPFHQETIKENELTSLCQKYGFSVETIIVNSHPAAIGVIFDHTIDMCLKNMLDKINPAQPLSSMMIDAILKPLKEYAKPGWLFNSRYKKEAESIVKIFTGKSSTMTATQFKKEFDQIVWQLEKTSMIDSGKSFKDDITFGKIIDGISSKINTAIYSEDDLSFSKIKKPGEY